MEYLLSECQGFTVLGGLIFWFVGILSGFLLAVIKNNEKRKEKPINTIKIKPTFNKW